MIPFTNTNWFGFLNFTLRTIGLMVRFYTHIYLMRMGFKMQALFRKYNLTQCYCAEVIIVASYLIFVGYWAYWYCFKPITIAHINASDDYECSPSMQQLAAVLLIW